MFVEDEFTSNAHINGHSLSNAVKVAVKALNNVLIEGKSLHPLQEQQQSVND
jgi:hypothetical protein